MSLHGYFGLLVTVNQASISARVSLCQNSVVAETYMVKKLVIEEVAALNPALW